MCGRYVFDSEIEPTRIILSYIESRFGPERAARLKTGEIFPSSSAAVILTAKNDPLNPEGINIEEGKNGAQLIALPMVWGFPAIKTGKALINARQETITEKPSFKESYRSRRCVIPTTGFIEWSHDDKGRAVDKYLFQAAGQDMLFLAGIYAYIDKIFRFVILTTAANQSLIDIHHRQPLIIPQKKISSWIDDPISADELRNDPGPELIRDLYTS